MAEAEVGQARVTGGGFIARWLARWRVSGQPADAEPSAESEACLNQHDPVADAALLALRRHDIRPTPEAYTLWYRHIAGERPDLTRRLKELEERGERFDAALIGELFERYFGSEREVLQVAEASHNAERLLAALEDDMDAVEADARARGDRLGRLGAELEQQNGLGAKVPSAAGTVGALAEARRQEVARQETQRHEAMRELVAGIVHETAEMRVAALRLQRRVVESAAEIAQLRATIEAVGSGDEQDPVSGVANRRVLHKALRRAAIEADGDPGKPLCFLIADLDDFRAFNQAHGRRLGDLVLKAVAQQLAMAIKRGDTIGRLDGAAFGIVLARTDLAGGTALAERLCRVVAESRLELGLAAHGGNAAPIAATVAIGLAAYHPGEPLKRLVGRADRARTHAKEAGGNRAVSERTLQVVGRPKA